MHVSIFHFNFNLSYLGILGLRQVFSFANLFDQESLITVIFKDNETYPNPNLKP